MQADCIIESYAIGGAVGATFYLEPVATLDVDMTFDLAKILQSKREFRQRLAGWPIAEKLAMLDALRERALAIRPGRPASEAGALREEPSPQREQEEKTE